MICAASAVLVLSALLYVFFFIGESLDVEEASFSHKARNFFDIGLIKALVRACVARRPNYGRAIIGCTTSISVIENSIQPFVAQISMTSSMLNNVWPGIVVLFIGPWSDKFGRRPVLLVTYAASFIGYILTATLVSVSETLSLNPWFYLLGGIPFTIVGGGTAMMTIVFCYISDVSDMESKAKRMFYIDMAMGLGVVAGNVLGSYLLRLTSVTVICAASAVLVLSALLYVFFFIGESLDVEEASFSHKARYFFDIGLIKALVRACVARRPNYGRAIIGCTTSISVVMNFIMSGEISIFYLFLRNKFNVTLQQFTYYNAAAITIKMLGCGVAFGIFRKLFKVSFAMVAIIGLAGCIFDSLTRALAQSFWQMYMASCFGFMSGITAPMLQAIISFAVPSNEIGKVFSLSSCVNTLTPLAAAPLYTLVYNHTLNIYPGLFNFISVGLYVECIVVMILVYICQRRIANRSNALESGSETEESQIRNIPTETAQPARTS
ncbi:PREDICTED: proton-coupled folate transporter-like [Rhagoletis zephyria]|uniref:proton-coupled folate transporter-like n=1 Tax=Rhagoletis zephyria TaxID=28612 RepID=UPI00081168D1|nr:PREDICTED: proton-coupled folate transporter-like [Rhagoletis zephyria]